ncbi:MAG: YraN family protein [Mariniphaga sp.]|nr:YraN family protein [Mariniphaga sp.]
MASTKEIGEIAEGLAQQHILKLGYKIKDSNWHFGHLELDIIAQDGDQLVIVEVKSRNGIRYEHPSEAVTNSKIKRIVEAAEAYIFEKDLNMETRFDVITVIFFKQSHELEHFKDAFYPTM